MQLAICIQCVKWIVQDELTQKYTTHPMPVQFGETFALNQAHPVNKNALNMQFTLICHQAFCRCVSALREWKPIAVGGSVFILFYICQGIIMSMHIEKTAFFTLPTFLLKQNRKTFFATLIVDQLCLGWNRWRKTYQMHLGLSFW